MGKKLKVLHTTTRMVRGGGVESDIYHYISKLHEDFDFHLASGIDFQANPLDDVKNLKIIICPDLIHKINPVKDLKAIWFFYKLIKKERYDIVHTHETKASLITRIAAWLAGCKFIIYGIHGVTFNDPMSRLKRSFFINIEKYTIGFSDFLIPVGQDVIDHYHKNGIGRNIPYQVVRSGIEMDAFFRKAEVSLTDKTQLKLQYGIKDSDKVIINVGRFSFSKAQRYTIESFSRLKKEIPDIKLLFAGEGELLEACKKQVKDLGLEESVIFTGYTDKIIELLSISDLFLFTSLREGLPRVILEAYLMKVPVITFEVEGAREVITNGESGYIVKQYDLDSLTFYAQKLLIDDSLRKDFGNKSHNYIKTNWDADLMASQLKLIYNSAYTSK